MRLKKSIILASVFLISIAVGAHASVSGPGIPGIVIPKLDGGPLGIPIKTALSMNSLLKNISDLGVETADDGKKAAGQRSALAGLNAGVQKAMALYKAHMANKSNDFTLGNTHKDKMRSAFSRLAGAALVSMTGLKATTGPTDRALKDMYSGTPRDNDDEYKDQGRGGMRLEALKIMNELCQSKGLPSTVSKRLAASQGTTGCSTDEEMDGMATSTAKLTGAPKGVEAGPGGKHNKVILAGLRLLRFGVGVQQVMAYNGYHNMHEALVAEIQQEQLAKKIIPAVYHPDGQADNGFIKAAFTDDTIITQMKGIGRRMNGDNEVAERMQAITPHASLPNPGADIYKDAAKQAKEFCGDETPYKQGRYPSASAATEIAACATGRQAEKAANAGATEAEVNQTAVALRGTQETARGNSLKSNETAQAGTVAFNQAVESLAMIIDSPEYQSFVASLDKKTLDQIAEWARKDLETNEIQVAANYNAHLFRNNIPVMYAVNGDKFPANMKGMLASVGVNGNSMLPTGDMLDIDHKFQMAALTPILNMKQYDPIEPVATQLALRDSVEMVTQVAQSEPITAAIKAIPIASVSQ